MGFLGEGKHQEEMKQSPLHISISGLSRLVIGV